MENPIKMDDLGVPLFLETPISFIAICRNILDVDTSFDLLCSYLTCLFLIRLDCIAPVSWIFSMAH